jgi:hypothetical protein
MSDVRFSFCGGCGSIVEQLLSAQKFDDLWGRVNSIDSRDGEEGDNFRYT